MTPKNTMIEETGITTKKIRTKVITEETKTARREAIVPKKFENKPEASFTPLNTDRTKILSEICGLPFFQKLSQMKILDRKKNKEQVLPLS